MILRLLHIDFDASQAAFAAYSSDRTPEALPELLSALESRGIESATFYSERSDEDRVRESVANSQIGQNVDVVVTGDRYAPAPSEALANAIWSSQRSGEAFVTRTSPSVHAMRFTKLDVALDRLTAAIIVLGRTVSCKGTCNNLRLACYELAANTIEHADFDVDAPEIRIGIRAHRDGIQLSFRDNALPFDTRTLSQIDVGKKITSGERRGLGLFMLSKLADSFSYDRVDGWNVTTMSLPDSSSEKKVRRNAMSEINIMITPCSVDRTIVLRPVGTVDSATSGVLETQISELLKQDINRIVIDMADVEFISSSGIGVFLGSVSGLRSRGGDLLFMNVPSHVEDVFDIVNLRDYFRIIDNLNELQPSL